MWFHFHNNLLCKHRYRYLRHLYSSLSHDNLVYGPDLKGCIHCNLKERALKFKTFSTIYTNPDFCSVQNIREVRMSTTATTTSHWLSTHLIG